MVEQLTYPDALEQLRKAYEQEKIQFTARISTLEVEVSQQIITIQRLQESLAKAQNVVFDNVQTILRLQECTNQTWLQEIEGEKDNA